MTKPRTTAGSMTGPKKLYRGTGATAASVKLTPIGLALLEVHRERAGQPATDTQARKPMSRGDFVEHLLRLHAAEVPNDLLVRAEAVEPGDAGPACVPAEPTT